MSYLKIKGYGDRPSAAPGESLTFHVSLAERGDYEASVVRVMNGDTHPGGPGPWIETVEHPIAGTYDGGPQRTQAGGYVEVADPDGTLAPSGGFAVHAFVWPSLPEGGRQAILSRFDVEAGCGWALELVEGALRFTVADGAGGSASVSAPKGLFGEVWYSVLAVHDPEAGRLTLSQKSVINRVNSRFGPVVDYDGDCLAEAAAGVAPGRPAVPLLIAGAAESAGDERTWVVDLYSGKIDSPKILAGCPDEAAAARLHAGEVPDEVLAHWDFGAAIDAAGGATETVADTSGAGLDGRCRNQPDQAMTGWNWTGEEDKWTHAPDQYGAFWFHSDSLEDSRWEPSLELEVPAGMASGCYALKVEVAAGAGDEKEETKYLIPFFVTAPKDGPTAPILILIPSYSYVVYGNSQVYQKAPEGQLANGHLTVLEDLDFELNAGVGEYGLSCYDQHLDGKGVQYATWKRPLLSLQPGYQHEFGAVWQYPADLHLVDWCRRQGFEVDVATDHDLEREGVELLRRYRCVVSGTHPEYYSGGMFDAWEDYLATGGRGMYLAGNGFYWVTTPLPGRPHLLEVRRGESGDAAWRSRPGEMYHSANGEKGGLWRYRARAPQKIWGTGYTSHTMAVSGHYVQMPDAADPRAAWIMEGIDPGETIGDFGVINEGAAGLEVDRADPALGTPPNTLLLASSVAHGPNAMLVPEEYAFAHPAGNGDESPLVRGDITYFTTPEGGGMFATSSMSWCGSLSYGDGDNNVSRLTANVLRRFAADEPLDPLV